VACIHGNHVMLNIHLTSWAFPTGPALESKFRALLRIEPLQLVRLPCPTNRARSHIGGESLASLAISFPRRLKGGRQCREKRRGRRRWRWWERRAQGKGGSHLLLRLKVGLHLLSSNLEAADMDVGGSSASWCVQSNPSTNRSRCRDNNV
jgi:hypothetical protein